MIHLASPIDQMIDYIPFLSTVHSGAQLIIKIALSNILQPLDNRTLLGKYIDICKNKSAIRIAIVCIPIIGNISVFLWDFLKFIGSNISIRSSVRFSNNHFSCSHSRSRFALNYNINHSWRIPAKLRIDTSNQMDASAPSSHRLSSKHRSSISSFATKTLSTLSENL